MLWPFAAKCIEDRLNNLTVNDLGITPEMSFSGSQASHVQLKNYHPFGCPCYVLDSRVQTNPKGLPKWEPRARLAIYVGHSPAHAGSVALVLNPKTGLISPQYHVVFDDNFTTIPNLRVGSKPSNWEELVCSSTEVATERDYDITRTWFKQESDPTADEELTSDDVMNNVDSEDVRTIMSKQIIKIQAFEIVLTREEQLEPMLRKLETMPLQQGLDAPSALRLTILNPS
jgi:hypothetical protein